MTVSISEISMEILFVLMQVMAGFQGAQQICWMNLPTQVPDCANPESYDDFC